MDIDKKPTIGFARIGLHHSIIGGLVDRRNLFVTEAISEPPILGDQRLNSKVMGERNGYRPKIKAVKTRLLEIGGSIISTNWASKATNLLNRTTNLMDKCWRSNSYTKTLIEARRLKNEYSFYLRIIDRQFSQIYGTQVVNVLEAINAKSILRVINSFDIKHIFLLQVYCYIWQGYEIFNTFYSRFVARCNRICNSVTFQIYEILCLEFDLPIKIFRLDPPYKREKTSQNPINSSLIITEDSEASDKTLQDLVLLIFIFSVFARGSTRTWQNIVKRFVSYVFKNKYNSSKYQFAVG